MSPELERIAASLGVRYVPMLSIGIIFEAVFCSTPTWNRLRIICEYLSAVVDLFDFSAAFEVDWLSALFGAPFNSADFVLVVLLPVSNAVIFSVDLVRTGGFKVRLLSDWVDAKKRSCDDPELRSIVVRVTESSTMALPVFITSIVIGKGEVSLWPSEDRKLSKEFSDLRRIGALRAP